MAWSALPSALLLRAAEEIAREAGQLLRERYAHPRAISAKSTPVDLVTDSDRAADALIRTRIAERFPDHVILTEESSWSRQALEGDHVWIVDPLDGTTNFAHGIPHFAVSIGVAQQTRDPEPSVPELSYLNVLEVVAGVVYDPMRSELFSARLGEAAELDGAPIGVSRTSELARALLATGFPYDRATHARSYLAPWHDLLPRCRDVRRMGAAALDLAWVACGRIDGFWEWGLKPWDVAAGRLIVRQAGGRTSDFTGADTASVAETLATNGAIHDELVAVLEAHRSIDEQV